MGIIGSCIGGLVFRLAGLGPTNVIGSLISATVGACVFLVLLRYWKKR